MIQQDIFLAVLGVVLQRTWKNDESIGDIATVVWDLAGWMKEALDIEFGVDATERFEIPEGDGTINPDEWGSGCYDVLVGMDGSETVIVERGRYGVRISEGGEWGVVRLK